MSRFRKLSHTLWHCQYHIVWVPKYRFRILSGKVKSEVETCIRTFVDQRKADVVELNVLTKVLHFIFEAVFMRQQPHSTVYQAVISHLHLEPKILPAFF